jgi:hypothetical protein
MEYVAIGATLLGGVGSVLQGSAAASAAMAERAQIEEQKAMNELQAIDEERARREKLNRVLSAQRAQAAAMGIDPDRSGSFGAMQRADITAAEREIDQIRLMGRSASRQLSIASQSKGAEATGALLGGYLRFGGALAKAGYQFYQLDAGSGSQKGSKP